MRLSSFVTKPSLVHDISSSDVPKRTTTVTKSRSYGARYCHAIGEAKASVAINRRMTLTLLLLLFTIVSDCRVDAQSSYNNNDYGYDDEQEDSNSGYAPKPPPVVDNLYYDYAARQEAKVGLSDAGTNLGDGGGNG